MSLLCPKIVSFGNGNGGVFQFYVVHNVTFLIQESELKTQCDRHYLSYTWNELFPILILKN